ncbi:hypothetical protein ABZP36_034834 [Zizania latifolia]
MVVGKEVVPAAEGETMDAVADGKVEALQGIPVTDDGNDEAPVAEGVNAIAAERDEEEKEVKWLKHYSSMQSILTVGDGDFSFSRALATAFGSGENLVATSLDTYGSTLSALSCRFYARTSDLDVAFMVFLAMDMGIYRLRTATKPCINL